jgi:hypothetical protein
MRHLILSVDYEIFGNGAGDVIQHVTGPTERMGRLCDEHKVPLTVFFEVEEYLAFVRYRDELQRDLGYDPAAKIRQQLLSLAAAGHDLQLHLHPQWFGAERVDGRWLLHDSKQSVDDLFESQAGVTQYIRDRKQIISDLLKDSGSRRTVVAYRAGAFTAQPSVKLLPALAANGILVDTSVVKGLTRRNGHLDHFSLDYRSAPSAKEPWRVRSDVAKEDVAGPVWEVPIYSVQGRRFQQATWNRLRAKFSSNVPKDHQRKMVKQLGVSRNPWNVLKFMFQPVPIKLDFHNLSPQTLLRLIRSAPAPSKGLPDIVMLIGHTKEHIDDVAFAKFLQMVSADSNLKVVGMNEVANLLPSPN